MTSRRTATIVVLGGQTGLSALAVDMYLPALPAIAAGLGAAPGATQLTLASFFLGFALGQAAYGPLADRFGRKPPLYGGLALFVTASIGCALAPTVEVLAALRFIQAVGACAGGVIATAMVRDLYAPEDNARAYAALMLVNGAAPMLAPLIGGYLLIGFGWRAIFWALAGFGLVMLAAAWRGLPESHDRARAQSLAPGRVLAAFAGLLADRRFLGYALAASASLAGMFAYIAAAPFVFIVLHGVPAERFGWLFGANALGVVLAGQLGVRLRHRIAADRLLCLAWALQGVAGVAFLGAAVTGVGGIAGLAVPLFVYISGVGLMLPTATALAMAPHGALAGTASALLGTVQFVTASLTATAIGALNDGSARPLGITLALCGAAALGFHRLLVGTRSTAPAVNP